MASAQYRVVPADIVAAKKDFRGISILITALGYPYSLPLAGIASAFVATKWKPSRSLVIAGRVTGPA